VIENDTSADPLLQVAIGPRRLTGAVFALIGACRGGRTLS
jgi:hypothetical protein